MLHKAIDQFNKNLNMKTAISDMKNNRDKKSYIRIILRESRKMLAFVFN